MSIKIEWIGNFNPFDFMACPACGGKEFTSLSLSSAWCDNCNTNFRVRHTAGDPGCVVDADTKDAYGPFFHCPTCSYQAATLDPGIDCPSCKKPMARKEGYSGALMENPPRKWYMILKTGDYCSGWIRTCTDPEKISGHNAYDHPSCHNKDLQAQWEEHQQKEGFRIDKDALPGGLRWQTIAKKD